MLKADKVSTSVAKTSKTQFVTSKLKFSIEYGPQQVTLTGETVTKPLREQYFSVQN